MPGKSIGKVLSAENMSGGFSWYTNTLWVCPESVCKWYAGLIFTWEYV
jgi:hypothetical protein